MLRRTLGRGMGAARPWAWGARCIVSSSSSSPSKASSPSSSSSPPSSSNTPERKHTSQSPKAVSEDDKQVMDWEVDDAELAEDVRRATELMQAGLNPKLRRQQQQERKKQKESSTTGILRAGNTVKWYVVGITVAAFIVNWGMKSRQAAEDAEARLMEVEYELVQVKSDLLTCRRDLERERALARRGANTE